MDRNYSFSVHPGYTKTRRGMMHPNTGSDTIENTLASIRRRLSNAVLSVPYASGLGSINLLAKQYEDISHSTHRPYSERDRSEDFSLFLKNNRDIIERIHHRPDRIGSNKSKTSDVSRTSSLKSGRDGSKTRIVKHKTTFKRVPSETLRSKNLEYPKDEHISTNDQLDIVGKFRIPTDAKVFDYTANPRNGKIGIVVKAPDNVQYGGPSLGKDIRWTGNAFKRNECAGYLLHPPSIETEEQNTNAIKSVIKSTQSVSDSRPSNSLCSSLTADDGPKRRHVEFNLIPKESIKLPPINSSPINALSLRAPKSILKKGEKDSAHGIKQTLEKPKFSSSFTSSIDEDRLTTPETRWQLHLPRLRSPVPHSASRRHPVAFKRSAFQLRFKCSKDFETVASEFDSDVID